MKLTDVIEIWDRLHVKDTGEVGYSDLQEAVQQVVGIEHNISKEQPGLPSRSGLAPTSNSDNPEKDPTSAQ